MNSKPSTTRRIVIVCGLLGVLLFFGCKENNDVQEITLHPVPANMVVNSSNQCFMIEKITRFILMGSIDAGNIDWNGQLYKNTWSFSPWGVDVGGQDLYETFFVTGHDVNPGSGTPYSILLALPALDPLAQQQNEYGNYNVLTEIRGVSGEDPFTHLRAVASLTINPGEEIIRVFLIDDKRIVVLDFDYDVNTPMDSTFSPRYTIDTLTGPCTGGGDDSDAFVLPFGLAVDPEESALYVADLLSNKIYRFTGIEVTGDEGSSVTCDGEISVWGDPEDSLSDPSGLAVLPGQPSSSSDNIIYVADYTNARVVAFKWEGSSFIWDDSISTSNKKPFDLAFDENNTLWGTYPASYSYNQVVLP